MSCPDQEEQDEDVLDCPPLPALASPWCRLRSGKRGRIVKAAQAIPTPGTTVLQDEPYAAVVSDIYRNACCAACLHVCTTHIFVCGGCSVTFYCSSECVARDGALVHRGAECQALKKLAAMGVEGDSQAMRLALRLACLTKKEDAVSSSSSTAPSPPSFHSPAFIRSLEDHYDDAMQDPAVRQGILAVAEALASFVNSSSSSSNSSSTTTTSRHEIASFLLTIQCNAHGIRDSAGRMLGLGLFPLASMLNHSCLPSCHHVFSLHPGQGPPTLIFKTLHAVQEGEELVYSYTDLMRPGGMRREILGRAYFFKCACDRCLITLPRGGEEGRDGKGVGSSSSVADALTEWALESPACDSTGCVGAWCPLKEGGKGGEEDGNNGDGVEGARESTLWVCLGCSKQEEASKVQTKLTVGTTLLQACSQALQEEEQQQQQQEEDADAAPQAPLLSDAARSLATHLFGNDPPLRLHARHWLVYHALASLGQHLTPHAGERGEEKIGVSVGGGESEEVAWLRVACEVWALRNLWRLSGGEGRREGGKKVSYHPELGERLVAAGRALLAYEAATSGTKKFEEEKECGVWTLPPAGEKYGDMIGRGPQALLRLGQEILAESNPQLLIDKLAQLQEDNREQHKRRRAAEALQQQTATMLAQCRINAEDTAYAASEHAATMNAQLNTTKAALNHMTLLWEHTERAFPDEDENLSTELSACQSSVHQGGAGEGPFQED